MINAIHRCAIESLTAEYWRRVDRQVSAPVDALYIDEGRMQLGALYCMGREQIREFFIRRTQQEITASRTTRHFVSGLVITFLNPGRMQVHSTVQVLAGTGDWPMASAPAASVADFEDVVIEVSSGNWLFESRSARIVFTGPGAASFAR